MHAVEITAKADPDRPRSGALFGVIVGGFVVGLLLARQAVGAPPPPSSAEAPAAEVPIEDAVDPLAEAVALPLSPSADGEIDAPPSTVAGSDGPTAAEAPERSGDPTRPEPEPARVAVPVGPTPAGAPPGWTRLVHGRIAYLRCEGIPVPEGLEASDAAGCPRDRALEELVWRAVDGLGECATAPSTVGELDLVVDLTAGAPPEVRTRDRFAPDVVRMDGAAVVSCVTAPLSTVASTLGATRLVVSFRFRAQP